jgi:hypothetical protein
MFYITTKKIMNFGSELDIISFSKMGFKYTSTGYWECQNLSFFEKTWFIFIYDFWWLHHSYKDTLGNK